MRVMGLEEWGEGQSEEVRKARIQGRHESE